MPTKVQLDTTAPDFVLEDSRGQKIRLSAYQG